MNTPERWQTSMWTYPWDVHDEGPERVAANIQERGGVGGILLAMSYHSGLFFLPHNPARKVYYPRPSLYFRPDPARYARLKIQPVVHELAHTDLLVTLRALTAARGMRLGAWVVCMHNTGLGTAYGDCTTVNAFGDHMLTNLCPANPDVRAYTLALVGDLLNRDFDSIALESLEYMPFQHGFHHEVVGVPLTPYIAWLIGLCFCQHCRRGAEHAGVDVSSVQTFVRQQTEKFLGGALDAGCEGITWPAIRQLCGGELGAFHQYRIGVVTSLFAEVSSLPRASKETHLEAIDLSILNALGPDDSAFSSGLDIRATAPYVSALHPCPYFLPLDLVRQKMDAYRALVPDSVRLIPAIRAILPQTATAEQLRERMEACRPETLAGFSFYNYGFMHTTTLDWIRAALAALPINQ